MASLIAAAGSVIIITFAVILSVPASEPRAVSVSNVVDAYKDSNNAPEHGLRRHETDKEPTFNDDSGLARNTLLEFTLAAKLSLRASDVRVFGPKAQAVAHLSIGSDVKEGLIENLESKPISSFTGIQPFSNAKMLAIDERFISSGLIDKLANLEVLSLEVAAIKTSNNNWLVFTRVKPFWTGWRLQAVLAFGLSMIVLLPISLIAGNRLSQPLRDLANLANGSQLNNDLQSISVGGAQEVRSAAEALINMHRRIRAEVAQRERVVAALAHDIRTPLTSLRVRVETAVSENKRDKFVFDIWRMEQMIQDMMIYARGIGKAPDLQLLDLQVIVATCLDDARMQTAVKRHGTTEPVWVLGEALSLQRALSNLLENAIKYGRNPVATVNVDNEKVFLIISNESEMILDTDLSRLLDPFERGEQSRNRDTGGTGLGLAIVNDIVKLHDGSLTMKKTVDGVEVIIELPLAKACL